ncbi:hypothetical protein CL621_02935 [archaeon]|nr:hypothetical protein [archaeon]
MVLESLVNPLKAERQPYEMFFIGLLYASIAIFLSIWIFKEYSSLVMVFLTVFACVPLMYSTLKLEEKKDIEITGERRLLREHGKALKFFVFLFMGFVIAFSIWYIVLPAELVQTVFGIQTQTIEAINARLTGGSINLANTFSQIFFNNLKVLLFCVFFSFFYGAGAIFILTWNASVISAAIGNFIRNNLAASAQLFGISKIWSYFHVFSLGLLRYFIHGIPEILAYFIGGLSGGIISVAIIRHNLSGGNFRKVFSDSLDLLVIAVFFLFIAALIEVFITPLLF